MSPAGINKCECKKILEDVKPSWPYYSSKTEQIF